MKRGVFTSVIVLLSLTSFTQSRNILDEYLKAAKQIDASIICKETKDKSAKMVLGRTLDTLFKPIFSNVIVGSDDLTQNASATSFVQDKDKGTLNINFSAIKNRTIYNLGVFSKSKDGIFGVYTNKSWSSEIGVNTGFSFISGGNSQYFFEDSCEILRKQRKLFIASALRKYEQALAIDTNTINKRVDSIKKALNGILENRVSDITTNANIYKALDSTLKALDSLKKLFIEVAPDTSTTHYMDRLQKDISKFEKDKAPFVGYDLLWASISFALSNNSISLPTDKLADVAKQAYKPKNLAKMQIGIHGNYTILAPENRFFGNSLVFIKVGADFGLTNYLDQPSIKKPELRVDGATNELVIFDDAGNQVGSYNRLRSNIITMEPGAYMGVFFGKKKQLGFDVRLSTKIPLRDYEVEYRKIFTFAAGPVFRLNSKDALSKGTIGVEFGLMDASYGSKVWKEGFGAKIKIGVPFNAIIK